MFKALKKAVFSAIYYFYIACNYLLAPTAFTFGWQKGMHWMEDFSFLERTFINRLRKIAYLGLAVGVFGSGMVAMHPLSAAPIGSLGHYCSPIAASICFSVLWMASYQLGFYSSAATHEIFRYFGIWGSRKVVCIKATFPCCERNQEYMKTTLSKFLGKMRITAYEVIPPKADITEWTVILKGPKIGVELFLKIDFSDPLMTLPLDYEQIHNGPMKASILE